MSLEISYEKFAEGLLASAGTDKQVQGQTSSPASRLVGRDHFLYRIPLTHGGNFSALSRVCREKQVPDWENCKEMHYNVLPKMQCRTLYRAVL